MNNKMNSKYIKVFALLISICVIIVICLAFVRFQQKNPEIGTWINQQDKNAKWVFTKDGKTKWYYEGNLKDVFNYKFTDTSPVCGKTVQTNHPFSFLQLTDVDKGNQLCYYVNGLTDSTLSLEPFGTYTILFFRKKK